MCLTLKISEEAQAALWPSPESGPDFGETAFGGAQLCGSAFSTHTNEGECCWSWAMGMAPSMAEDTTSVKSAGGAGSRDERARNTPVMAIYGPHLTA